MNLSSHQNTIPGYTTHYLGAGGLVFKEGTNEILVVKDRFNTFNYAGWKLPGGLVNFDENICDGAAREVLEETGVYSQPVGILGFRERSNYIFGMGDIYHIVLLKGLSESINADPDEISDARWMDFYEWMGLENASESRRIIQE